MAAVVSGPIQCTPGIDTLHSRDRIQWSSNEYHFPTEHPKRTEVDASVAFGLRTQMSPGCEYSDAEVMFREQRVLINFFFDRFEASHANTFVNEIVACTGTVFFSGVGKSGFICQKIAMSLASIGVRASFLNPLDALHGDIGNCGSTDLLVLFSKSGSTAELLATIPGARSKSMKIISVVCHQQSALSRMSDITIHLPLQRELCAFNLAPVTSTAIQLIFGDTVTAAIMRKLKVTLESYALNHPAGSIGRKLLLTVRDVMRTGCDLPRISTDSTLQDAILEMTRAGVGCVLMTQGNLLRGIFTDGDLRRLLAGSAFDLQTTMRQHITKMPFYIDDEIMKLVDAENFFHSRTRPVSCLPVVRTLMEGVELVGLLVLSDTLKALA